MRLTKTTLLIATVALGAGTVMAQGIDDPTRAPYYSAFEGKTVAYVPVAMGVDLTEGWAAGLRAALEPLGVKFEIRDPNWSTDAGAQAITSLISEKPDVVVVHNPDVQSYARLLKKAEEAGIYVVQVNMRSTYSTDAFVGVDYVGMGEQIANRLIDKCSPEHGGNGKIAITQGVLTAAASVYQMQGINNVLEKHAARPAAPPVRTEGSPNHRATGTGKGNHHGAGSRGLARAGHERAARGLPRHPFRQPRHCR